MGADLQATPKVLMFQAGSLSWWLIYRLFPDLKNTFFVDVGRPLDIWYPDVVGKQPWFRHNKDFLLQKMGLEGLFA